MILTLPAGANCGSEEDPLDVVTNEDYRDLQRRVSESPTNLASLDRSNLVKQLMDLYETCTVPNWDGEGAKRIPLRAFDEADRLRYQIPTTFPAPDIDPDPSGGIGFEWYQGKNRVFVITVAGTGVVTYAGLLGPGATTHGTEILGKSLPAIILTQLMRLFSSER